jgi:acetyltransferase-like isoleucine patch superfamily enzyme
VLSRNARLIIEKDAQFHIGEKSILQIGYVSPEWKHLLEKRKTVVLIQPNGRMECHGNVVIGNGTRIKITSGAHLKIGEGSSLNINCTLFVEKRIEIGRNCLVSWDVEFMDSDFHRTKLDDDVKEDIGIVIKDHVWIGAGARILKNVEIGNNVIIGANSVVTKSFPDNSIIAGNPARKVGEKEGSYRI